MEEFVPPPNKKSKDAFEDWYVVEPNSGCWLWLRGGTTDGYGQVRIQGKVYRAHRLAWELWNGPIPDGQYVCHRCDVPACVNPNHLFLGDMYENVADMMRKGRNAYGEKTGSSKLTEREVIEIRDLDKSSKKAAARYGISVAQMVAIRNGRKWKHLIADS